MKQLKNKLQSKGVSPVIGVILMVAITVVLAGVVGTAVFSFTDGGLEENVQAGVDLQETPDGVEVSWTQSGNADSIEVQVDGTTQATLDTVGDRVVIDSSTASGKTVSTVAVDEEGNQTVVSSEKSRIEQWRNSGKYIYF